MPVPISFHAYIEYNGAGETNSNIVQQLYWHGADDNIVALFALFLVFLYKKSKKQIK